MWRYVAAILVATAPPPRAAADIDSASRLLPGCKFAIDGGPTRYGIGVEFEAARCIGYVAGLAKASPDFCQPAGVTVGQMIRVVVTYVEARPARHHEEFGELALEALEEAWPCRRNELGGLT